MTSDIWKNIRGIIYNLFFIAALIYGVVILISGYSNHNIYDEVAGVFIILSLRIQDTYHKVDKLSKK